ncbi:hypothetical protein, partial [uncultured Desulfovibrio sp.]|uniref:hypothetical protein n=1 Tax=uncultured Desulfovibrio sp. TaxID=167968 RepID=UPI0026098130
TIRPVVSRKKRGFSAYFGPGGAVPPPRVSPFSKVKRSIFVCKEIGGFWGRWGSLRGKFTGTPFFASLSKGWALFTASSDPTGGRRPCPSGKSPTGIDSRAKGFLPPQDKM